MPTRTSQQEWQTETPASDTALVVHAASIPDLPRRRMCIYTPPYYNSSQRYPVLYLLHGSGGDETSWTAMGRAAQILDNLIAKRQCVPMVVVMPNGIANRAAAPGADPYNKKPASSTALESMTGIIEKTFIPDIVRYVEGHYSVFTDRSHKAIAGLSLGGLHTIYITANNPQEFGYIGLFSAQTTNKLGQEKRRRGLRQLADGAKSLQGIFPGLKKGKIGSMVESITGGNLDIYSNTDKKLKKVFAYKPRLYYIACGKDDFVKKLNDDFRLTLSEGHYDYVYHETDGGHSWENWRKYLVDFLPRLFK